MPRNFISRDRVLPVATKPSKREPNRDLIARIEAYTLPPFADNRRDGDQARFLRGGRQPALLRTGL
jgi:hypothetical protein